MIRVEFKKQLARNETGGHGRSIETSSTGIFKNMHDCNLSNGFGSSIVGRANITDVRKIFVSKAPIGLKIDVAY